ncbi:unnamed protein product [Callosobruchus maculatus]|uniref:Torsin n=1 Tax=Callosobruchus maculatus TaxID=64391 RepID=A0A653D155_CALMS|nr:unnamed protein product [Callosobruchus maculatus]
MKSLALIVITLFINIKCVYMWSYNPLCLFTECCNNDYIPGDTNKLATLLRERVYGQHLVENAIHAIAAHWNPHYKAPKPLVLSFHGWAGSGKNYVSNFIAESLYKYGTKSKYVHLFVGRIHFPVKEDTHIYQQQLYSWLKGNITKCPKQLFIFDEVDKMPPDILNAIKPMIDYKYEVDGVDYTQSIFIFLSNTGSALVNEHYEDLWKKGEKREELRLSHFEKLIEKGVFNEEGGFHHSDTIRSNLIDHYIPFLPMQREHVEGCIKDQFRSRNVEYPTDAHTQEVMEIIEWGPARSKLFSTTGCKRISSKVALIVAKYYRKQEGKEEL